MNLENDLNKMINIEKQSNFLESSLGKVINAGLDVGLRAVLPNLIEDQIIEIKDVILESGFKEGINKAIESAIELGKSAIGIVTGEFENINQIKIAVKNGGIIDTASDLLDKAIEFGKEKDLINNTVSDLIKSGKNTILNQISENIEESLNLQVNAIEKLDKYCSNWNEYYNNKDFNGMQKEYNKIIEKLKEIVPIEQTIKNARIIETLHNLIKNKGIDFNLSKEEIELVQKLN